MKKSLVLFFTFLFAASAFALAQAAESPQPSPVVSIAGEITTGSRLSSHPKASVNAERGSAEARESDQLYPSITPDRGGSLLRGPRRPDVTLSDQLCIDDGVMANAWAFTTGGNVYAVQYTAPVYPTLIDSVQVYVLSEGDPYWPWPDAVHQPFAICIFDESTGQPGAEIFRDTVQADGTPPSWVMAYPGIPIYSGDFWVGAEQFDDNPNCEGMGVDASSDNGPQNWRRVSGVWTQNPGLGGDLMMCAFVSPAFDTSHVILSGNSVVLPAIDGVIDSLEWAEATVRDVSDFSGVFDGPNAPGSAFLYVKNDETNLYMALDAVWDNTQDDYDELSPYFDDNNDGLWPTPPDTSEVNLWFESMASGVDSVIVRCWQTGPSVVFQRTAALPVGVSMVSGHQQFEGVVPFGTMPEELQALPGDTVGFFLLSYHANGAEIYAWWPYDNANFNDPADYGDLVLAPGFPPAILEALASDNVDSIPGIDPDDYVLITFDEATNKPAITFGNIDNVLQLSGGHTWLDGFGDIGSAVWNGAGDRLMITLSTAVGPPTVAVGDTITSDGATITDAVGNACVSQIEITGSFGELIGVEELNLRAAGSLVFALSESSPNPFAGETEMRYSIPVKSDVSLKVYDVTGRPVRTLVANETEPGIHSAVWDGRDDAGSSVPAGVYLYRLVAAGSTSTRKLILVR
jgi:hypothetical protein